MHVYIPVPVICDPSSIVALSGEVSDGVIRHFIILIDEHLELPDTDAKVRLIEAIGYVPTKGTELTTLLHQSVEETKTKQQLFPNLQRGN